MKKDVVQEYVKMRKKASALIVDGKDEEGYKLFREADEFREKNFSPEDWKALLEMSRKVHEKIFLKKRLKV